MKDAIIILGAAVWATGPSPTLLRRTRHAAKLWHQNKARFVVPCGGLGVHPPTEAAAMQDLLLADGIPAAQIILEDKSTTTLENIRNACAVLPGRDVIIVTDGYHQARAKMVARHFGLQADMSSPDMPRLPLREHLREVVARPAYAWKLRRLPPRS
ncbi:YdcF family protein [Yoonia sp. SS1-5]|uniref:YdcF family protein n=1 Tax=Yoonia rhodophyticola TaxID=3137370 RepID=A0AAN0NKF8_9RHOB